MSISPNINTVSLLTCFHALSDPIRLQVIELLRYQELCVCELCEKLAIKQPKLSFHLKILKEADLLIPRQDGRWIYYRLNLAQFAQLEDYLSSYNQISQILSANICQE